MEAKCLNPVKKGIITTRAAVKVLQDRILGGEVRWTPIF